MPAWRGILVPGPGRVRSARTGHEILTTPGAIERPEVVLSGTAVQLYLSLWNRADELTTNGRSDLIDQWRKQIRIRWS